MKRSHLVLLLVVPFIMICVAICMFFAENTMRVHAYEMQKTAERFRYLATHPEIAPDPKVAIEALSASVADNSEELATMFDSISRWFHATWQGLLGLAILQAVFCLYVFWRQRRAKHQIERHT